VPTLVVKYHEFPGNASQVAEFLGVDAGTMRAIFMTAFHPTTFPLPQVELPMEWQQTWDRYKEPSC
jgi:hypothetical protein